MIYSQFTALATVVWLGFDAALWVGLIAIAPHRRKDQLWMALWGLLITGVMAVNWLVALRDPHPTNTPLPAWPGNCVIVFGIIVLGWLILALVRLYGRLKARAIARGPDNSGPVTPLTPTGL